MKNLNLYTECDPSEYLNQLQEQYKLIDEKSTHDFDKAIHQAFKRGEKTCRDRAPGGWV